MVSFFIIIFKHKMYLILIINQNLILRDHERNKINNKTEFSPKIRTKLSKFNFTIIVPFHNKCPSCYATEFIPCTYKNYQNVFLWEYFWSIVVNLKMLMRSTLRVI